MTTTNQEALEQALEDAYEARDTVTKPGHFVTVAEADAAIAAAAEALEAAGVALIECDRCERFLPEADAEWLQVCCVSWDCPGEWVPIHKGCDPDNDY